MVKSMTGYGRARETRSGRDITVEVRSVNNRYLDCTVKMPRAYIFAEDAIKGRVQKAISRGKVDVFVTIDSTGADEEVVVVNEGLARSYLEALRKLYEIDGGNYLQKQSYAADLARIPDVLTVTKAEEDLESVGADICEVLDEALASYNQMRATEGKKLAEDIELLDGAAEEFDLDKVLRGELSPVFFGSALTNFGVEPFLENFLRLTSAPLARVDSLTGEPVDPCRDEFSAFIFKIQANMNKAHRDRIAFMRICSGKFERGMEAYHVQEGKNIKLATGTQLMAQDRAIVDEAYAGDIIGLFDPGIFSIGDTLCTGKKKVEFAGIPTFSPEHFARIEQKDTMKRKQFVKGMEQIAQEGAIQIFREVGGGMEEVVVGVVGVLQLEVLEYRLNTEYNVEIRMQQLPFEQLRWVKNDPDTYNLRDLDLTSDTKAVEDMKGNRLLLFTSDWAVRWAETHNDTLELSEFGNI